MRAKNEKNLIKTPIYKRRLFIVFLLLTSMLPGTIISSMLFFVALSNNIENQNIRNSIPSVDLSQVEFNAGDDDYPKSGVIQSTGTFYGMKADIKTLTIKGVQVFNINEASQLLGNNYITIETSGRGCFGYYAYIDRENNLELRFEISDSLPWHYACLMRIDNRSSIEFLYTCDDTYGDSTTSGFYGKRIFDMLEPDIVFHSV